MVLSFINCHCHTCKSNVRLLDATNSVPLLLETAVAQNYGGVAITDHEILAAHLEAIQVTRKMKQEGTMPQSFKTILGNEIYLCDSLKEVKDNYQSGVTKFPHFLLLSKTKFGHKLLRMLSSRAWGRSYNTGLMTRTPTLKSDIEELVKPNKGHLIAGSACLGSEINIRLLSIKEDIENNNPEKAQYHREKLNEFILWCIEMFGTDHFFIELQPALSWEQIYCNKELKKIAEHYNLKTIITTDAHYLRPEDREIHEAFLNAKDGEREVASFYEACFLQSLDEIYERMDYFEKEFIDECIENTQLIGDMVEDYTIEHETVIPRIELPEFKLQHIFKPAYKQYEYIKKMAYSDDEQDRYLLKLIEDGFNKNLRNSNLTHDYFHKILDRVNNELSELWEIGKIINQNMGSYYITVKEICDVIWEKADSLIGSGRGSSSAFMIAYLLGITQINPLAYGVEIPHWRHLHKTQPKVSALDIDIDTEGSKRTQIIQALKEHFGEDKVLQVSVFGTETSKAALATACRGLGYDSDIALHLGSLIPFERGKNWSIKECLYGNEKKDREPVKEFINEIEKYPKLKETALGLNGLTSRRGIHAGGVVIFNEPYYESNALMTAPNGTHITQWSLSDSQSLGNIKYDLLTVESLDKIRTTLDSLIKNEEIAPEPTLRETFDKYLHPDVIDTESKEIYGILSSDTVSDVFQFQTDIARDAILKVKPSNLIETAAVNSLMRLQASSGEQPINTFVRFKNNIKEWYAEMNDYGLNKKEVSIMEKHLLALSGVSDTQENILLIAMDKNVAGFTVQEAYNMRKTLAGSPQENVDELKKMFMKKGRELGTRQELLDYVWNVQVVRQQNYSFSIAHVIPYTLMALQEINLNYHFNPIYWETACLIVNSGGIETEGDISTNTSNVNYGRVAEALSDLITRKNTNVLPPNINESEHTFTPDVENNAILYGLKGLVGIGDQIISTVISNRPYTSFSDFLTRLFDTKLIQNTHVLQLIKAGSFDSFDTRTNIMSQYINHVFEPRKQLTMQSFNIVNNLGVIPSEFDLQVRFYNYRQYIVTLSHGKSDERKTKNRLFLLNDIATEFFFEHFTDNCIVDYHDNGSPIVAEWLFEREYEKLIKPLREWFALESTVELVNEALLEEEWKTKTSGSIPKDEMSSLSYYYTAHELEGLNEEKYGVVNYSELPQEPIVTREYEYGGRTRQEFQLHRIAGTVLDKDKNRHTVTILTEHGVVTVKLYRSNYSYYDRQISTVENGKKTVVEAPWFKRGELLMFTGFRRGNQFVPRVYRDSIYPYSVQKITSIDEQGDLTLVSERTSVD